MALRRARRRCGGSAVWLLGLALAAGLSGCNGMIDTYGSFSGINKHDPDPSNALFTENLDKAESGSYPNLATVPQPPTIDTTFADRQKLAQNLTSTRSATEANGGTPNPGPVPPPPTIPAEIAAPQMANVPPAKQPPQTPIPPMRQQDEPPTPQPLNSTLQSPTLTNLPGVEASRAAPPPGHPAAIPQPAPSALPPAAVQSGNPQPSPPTPALPPPQVSPQVAALPPPKLPPVPITVASLDLPAGSPGLPSDAPSRIADVAARYKAKPGTVRIVSYAAPGTGGAEQLNSFRSALDRAQIIAKQLAGAGIPSDKIQTQAAPSSDSAPSGRIDIQLLP
jgi:hypothetical protein